MNLSPPDNSGEEIITKRQLAKLIGCSLRTVDRSMARRLIPFIKMGRLVRFTRDDVSVALKRLKVTWRK